MSQEQTQACSNCRAQIAESKIMLHEMYCERNCKKCETCGKFYDVNDVEQHEEDFHKNLNKPIVQSQSKVTSSQTNTIRDKKIDEPVVKQQTVTQPVQQPRPDSKYQMREQNQQPPVKPQVDSYGATDKNKPPATRDFEAKDYGNGEYMSKYSRDQKAKDVATKDQPSRPYAQPQGPVSKNPEVKDYGKVQAPKQSGKDSNPKDYAQKADTNDQFTRVYVGQDKGSKQYGAREQESKTQATKEYKDYYGAKEQDPFMGNKDQVTQNYNAKSNPAQGQASKDQYGVKDQYANKDQYGNKESYGNQQGNQQVNKDQFYKDSDQGYSYIAPRKDLSNPTPYTKPNDYFKNLDSQPIAKPTSQYQQPSKPYDQYKVAQEAPQKSTQDSSKNAPQDYKTRGQTRMTDDHSPKPVTKPSSQHRPDLKTTKRPDTAIAKEIQAQMNNGDFMNHDDFGMTAEELEEQRIMQESWEESQRQNRTLKKDVQPAAKPTQSVVKAKAPPKDTYYDDDDNDQILQQIIKQSQKEK